MSDEAERFYVMPKDGHITFRRESWRVDGSGQ